MAAMLLCVGDLNADITITASRPVVVGSDTPGTVVLSGGGSAANVAVGAARCGAPTRFSGVVGDDLLGQVLVDELAGHGIDVRVIRRADETSRSIAALIDSNGDRSMVSDLSGAVVLDEHDVDASWFDDVEWLHLTGYSYFPTGGPSLVRRLVEEATRRSIPWSFDPSSAEMLQTDGVGRDLTRDVGGAAVLVPNRDEASVLAGIDDPARAATALLDIAECVLVKAGADGAFVARRGAPPFHVAAVEVEVVNTLGCGDAFAGAFVASRMRGDGVRACVELAVAHAASVAALATSR